MGNRRSETRLGMDGVVKIQHASQPKEPIPGRISDLSQTGMSITTERPLPINDAVKVELFGRVFDGKVRRCNPIGTAFSLGVELRTSITEGEMLRLMDEYYKGLYLETGL